MGVPERIARRRPHPSCAGTPGSIGAPAQFRAVREQGARVRTRRSIRPGGLVRSARCGPHGLSSTWMAVIHSVRLLGEPRTAEYPVPTSSDDWRRYMTVVLTDGGRYVTVRVPGDQAMSKDTDENYFVTCRTHHSAETGSARFQLATLFGSLS